MATYYVDPAFGNNTGGTDWRSAWNTIGSAMWHVSAGDLVWIADGTYKEALLATTSGSLGAEIHIYAEHIGSVTIDGEDTVIPLLINAQKYWDFVGIKFYNSSSYGAQITGVAADRNRFYYCDATNNSLDGFRVDTDAVNTEFRCCKAQENGADGFYLNPTSASTRNAFCWNCLSVENSSEGFRADTKYATFLNCTAGSNGYIGLAMWWAYASQIGKIKHCISYGNGTDIPESAPYGITTYQENSDIDYNCSFGNVGSNWLYDSGYCNLTQWQGSTSYGDNSIEQDPLFVVGNEGSYYLSEIAAGQGADSPCVDAGSQLASDDPTFGTLWTRLDEVADSGILNLGYHYGVDWSLLSINPYPAPDHPGPWQLRFTQIGNTEDFLVPIENMADFPSEMYQEDISKSLYINETGNGSQMQQYHKKKFAFHFMETDRDTMGSIGSFAFGTEAFAVYAGTQATNYGDLLGTFWYNSKEWNPKEIAKELYNFEFPVREK